eukprot:Hpha_TRINITY_DN16222_c0_g2::TRINITY_DN16222_c0_g2_i1::g.11243::m.11243
MVKGDESVCPGANKRLSIGVVGTGISGLTAAYLLSRQHDIDGVFEAAPLPGMDSQSVTVGDTKGPGPRVDVPVRSFSPHYYPSLVALYRHLGLDLQRVDYSSSMSRWGGESCFQYSNFGIGKYTLPWVMPGTRSWKIAREWVYWQLRCWWHRSLKGLAEKTFEQFCRDGDHSFIFYEEWLLPICSSMLSCSIDTVRNYPADILVEFFSTRQSTFFTSWFRVKTGTAHVCEKLLAFVPQEKCHFSTRVSKLTTLPSGKIQVRSESGQTWEFDHVIVATEAAHVLGMLDAPSKEEQDVFSSFKYEKSHAAIHTDERLMPRRTEEWRTMNSFLPPSDGEKLETFEDGETRERKPERYRMSTVTVWVNTLIDVPEELGNVFQSWNPHVDPAPEKCLHTAHFLRAVHDVRAVEYLKGLQRLQGKKKIWFCGSYASRGMTLLEQACSSAIDVADCFGVQPWWPTPRESITDNSVLFAVLGVLLALTLLGIWLLVWLFPIF